MQQFNQDGSLKLPDILAKSKHEIEERMKKGNCISVKKDIISFTAPKKCILHIQLSEAIKGSRFIENIYKEFCEDSDVFTKIRKISEKEFEIEIENDFKRCSGCNKLIRLFNEFLDQNLIEEKGNCTYEPIQSSFAYEDYFD